MRLHVPVIIGLVRPLVLVALVAASAVLAACTSAGSPSPASSVPTRSATSAPSSSSSAAAAGLTSHTLTSDGRTRQYLLYRPASLPSGPAPLVVMLHGGSGDDHNAATGYGWDAEADRGHFAVAYPNGVARSWSVGGGCCGTPGQDDVDDVAFIEQVVHDVARQLPVDPRRVFATGISAGGMLAYRLACDTSLFAAIGPDSATLLGECPSPTPLSVLAIAGTADQRIPYDGTAGAGHNHINGPPMPALSAQWRSTDHCAALKAGRNGVVATSAASCPGGRAVELITIIGGGHEWPGHACGGRCRSGAADQPSHALDATSTFWRFFAAHPKPAS